MASTWISEVCVCVCACVCHGLGFRVCARVCQSLAFRASGVAVFIRTSVEGVRRVFSTVSCLSWFCRVCSYHVGPR